MQAVSVPLTRDLVLIGGGHTHALVLNAWAMRPLPGARLSVINPAPTAPYTGMLPGHVAGHYDRAALDIDLVRLCRRAGARLVLGKAEALDCAARLVHVPGRPPLAWDAVSVDIGITSDLPRLPGYAEHAVSVKPLGAFARAWEAFVARVREGAVAPQIAVIGAGVAGVEVALAMAWRLRDHPHTQITLLEAAPRALPNIGSGARQRLLRHVRAAGVALREGVAVTEVAPDAVRLADGSRVAAALTLGAAGSRQQDWLRDTGLDLTDGAITVDGFLRSVSDPMVFAVGDCAHMSHAPRPKAGVYAVRQAPFLFDNLRAALGAGQMRAYHPQRDYLKLVSLGDRVALADKWALPLEGRWLWWLKDRIDAKFMGQFRDPRPRPAVVPGLVADGVRAALTDKPLCGGCGAKLGALPLSRALEALPAPVRADVETGRGDDAAVLRVGGARQVVATDHLRALTDDPFVMARIAAVHALGDIWAMGAQPQAVLVSATLPRMSEALQARTLSEIMAGVQDVVAQAGAAIVGGHSSMGAELSIGLSVTGLLDARALGKGGARPGDALILTRSLGTGVILAAEMAWDAPGDTVAGALAGMQLPQGGAARCLAPLANAMTDVTGFGLAGHLLEILMASDVGALLDMSALPVLTGAEDLAARGHASILAAANRAAAPVADLPDTARALLVHDPQTAGGLLAAVPGEQADRAVAALHASGYPDAAIIGRVVAGPPVMACAPRVSHAPSAPR